jgi:hypothetical protein
MRYFIFGALLIFSAAAFAQSPIIVDPSNGKFLGNLNNNPYDINSVANPYGRYGSRYSADSINNPYGIYGNPNSIKSPHNPYATGAPQIQIQRGLFVPQGN